MGIKTRSLLLRDNMDRKPIEDVIFEINNFISSVVAPLLMPQGLSLSDEMRSITRSRIKNRSEYCCFLRSLLEKFESQRIHKTVDELATTMIKN